MSVEFVIFARSEFCILLKKSLLDLLCGRGRSLRYFPGKICSRCRRCFSFTKLFLDFE